MQIPRIGSEFQIQFLKFIGVGVLNTLISLGVIYLCMHVGINYRLSNLIGYGAGVLNSFIWNKLWVFRSKEKNVLWEMFLFGITFAACYGIQYGVLLLLVEKMQINLYLAQLIAMGVYTVCNFLLNRFITFRK